MATFITCTTIGPIQLFMSFHQRAPSLNIAKRTQTFCDKECGDGEGLAFYFEAMFNPGNSALQAAVVAAIVQAKKVQLFHFFDAKKCKCSSYENCLNHQMVWSGLKCFSQFTANFFVFKQSSLLYIKQFTACLPTYISAKKPFCKMAITINSLNFNLLHFHKNSSQEQFSGVHNIVNNVVA